ncbi:MAG TPA: IS1595 family transposase [Ignavibacteria bacterium]|nr:IS1595 family transposase [Ignavibacteria bacterium]
MKEFKSLVDLLKAFPDEQSCRDFVEKLRWNGKPECPHCKHNEVYKFKDGKLWKCKKCRKQFTVKVGTIFEDSALPLIKWFMAMYLLTAHKKGISSLQLSKDIGITQKSAWHMLHRLRYAMTTKEFNKPLSNTVECDETYVGGKNKFKHWNKKSEGTGFQDKQAVFGMIERKGNVIALPVVKADAVTLVPIILDNVDRNATIMTDEFGGYYHLGKIYKEHGVINHQSKMYVRGEVHTQCIDNFWSLLKRGIIGIYHQVSPKHLHRYCNEFAYRFNTKESSDVNRFAYTFSQINGKLQYKTLINN